MGLTSIWWPLAVAVVATTCSGCNISECIMGSTVVENTSSTATYHSCIANASGIRAFQCRCTLHVRNCLYSQNGGNCSTGNDVAYDACGRFVVDQNWGCSATLCDDAVGLRSSTALSVLAMMLLVSLS